MKPKRLKYNDTFYIVYSLLFNLLNSTSIKKEQSLFIETLLNEQEKRKNNPDLYDIQKQIRSELDKSSSHKSYKKKLLYILQIVEATIARKEKKLTASPNFTATAKLHDEIYTYTATIPDCQIVMPIQQSLDYRLLTSGVCFGYVMHWIHGFLHFNRANGIDFSDPISFIPHKYSGCHYPDLNHLYVITEDIAYKNRLFQSIPTHIKNLITTDVKNYVSTKKIAEHMLSVIAKNKYNAIELSIINKNDAHSLGLCKNKQGFYHFMDVNSGWYFFKSDQSFIQWLDFYFNKKGYTKNIENYYIRGFLPDPKQQKTQSLPFRLFSPKRSVIELLSLEQKETIPVHKDFNQFAHWLEVSEEQYIRANASLK